jgi:hypothetical protein
MDESAVHTVVKDCGEMPRGSGCDIGVGFLAKGIWIYYQPIAQWKSDPLAEYESLREYDSTGRIVYLSGTTAYIGEAGTDAQFVLGGVRVRIWLDGVAPPDPTLQAIAQSIVDRSK